METPMPQYYMTTQELKKLKPQDKVFIDGLTQEIVKVGTKWIELRNTRKMIDIAQARIKYTGYGAQQGARIYINREEYNTHNAFIERVMNIRKTVGRTAFPTEVLLDMEPVLIKHGYITEGEQCSKN